ncbi:MAG: transketolase family protein [Candidatus Poseidoniales archaeon]|jgi:transketolase|tara:strand:- start:14307 stop:15254 length:948 start_codon:yes stop_codon:yes gene_type:complete
MSSPSGSGASRDGYGNALLRLASNPDVVVLEADLGKSTKSCHFRSQYPERTFSLGIAEQNMMLVAAGLASSGKIPFASTFAIFTERAFEQVRNGIARPGLNAHICGSHGGIHTGSDGSSAQTIEDLAIYRTLPNMTVIHPADDISAEELTMQLVNLNGPSYMRTIRNKVTRTYDENSINDLEIGKGHIVLEGKDVAIISCGVMVSKSIEAAKILEKEGIFATVIDMHTIKPLDTELIDIVSNNCNCIVAVEDHSIIGGLGGAVCEHNSRTNLVPIEMIGVKDRFGESGSSEELFKIMNMTEHDIVTAAKLAIARK